MQSKLLAAGLPHVPQYQTKHSASSTGCLLFSLFDSSLPCRSMRCFCLGERLTWTTSRSTLRASNFLRSCNFNLFLSAQAEVFLDGGRCSFSGGSTTVVAMLQRFRQATVSARLILGLFRTRDKFSREAVQGQQKTRSTVRLHPSSVLKVCRLVGIKKTLFQDEWKVMHIMYCNKYIYI